jgi:hypothetical protein
MQKLWREHSGQIYARYLDPVPASQKACSTAFLFSTADFDLPQQIYDLFRLVRGICAAYFQCVASSLVQSEPGNSFIGEPPR